MIRRITLIYLFFFLAWSLFASQATASTIIIPAIKISPLKKNILFTENEKFSSASGGSKIILTREQMLSAGVSTIQSALKNLGGLTLTDVVGNGSRTSISMRGFGGNASSNTLILINGIPMTNPDLASANLNTIPLHDVELIEILAGTESVIYGDQAVGGVVNIMTRYQTKEKIDLTCHTGSYNEYGCYAWFANRHENLDYYLSPAHQHTDNYRYHNHYDQTFLNGGAHYFFAQSELRFDFTIGGEDMQYPGALTHQQVVENRRQANNDIDFFKDWNGFYHLQYQHHINSHWQARFDLSRRDMHGHGTLSSPFTQSRVIHFFKPQIKGTFANTTILMGLDAEDDAYNLNSAFGLTDEKQQKYSVFTLTNINVANISMLKRIIISIGARGAELFSHLNSFTKNNTINRAIATTIGGHWLISPELNVYLRRAENFRFPKADENAFAPIGVNSLRTQRGVSYETGVEWHHHEHDMVKLGLYQLYLRDEIAFDPTQTPQTPYGSDRNLNPTTRTGFTLSGKYSFLNKFTLDGQYNYVNARFHYGPNAGNRIPLVAENIIRAGLQYNANDEWHFYAETVYTGNQFAANDDANIAGRIGGYTLFNLNLRYQIKNFTVAFRIDNIFNKQYYFYTVYHSNINAESFYPAPERSFMLTLKYMMI